MATLSVATWIGNAAAVLSGRFGAISKRAKEADCSRQAMYKQAQRVEAAVACEQAGGPVMRNYGLKTSSCEAKTTLCGRP